MNNVDSGNWVSAVLSRGGLPRVARGEGIYIYDSAGKRYIDASGGPAVYCLGHSHPEVNEAVKRQLDRIAHAHASGNTKEHQ